jgi:predicted Zn finger-like uncharacterized protein
MPQLVSCPHCQRQLNVPDNLLGKNVKCPSCQNTFTASAAGPAPEPPAPSAAGGGAATGGGSTGGQRPHRGMLVMGLGIGGIVFQLCCPLPVVGWVCAVLAIIFGGADLKAMNRGEMDTAGRGQTNIGRILGFVGVGLLVLYCLIGCIYGILAATGTVSLGK